MNTGIQDAFNLGWKLAGVVKGELRESVLPSYHDERHPVAEQLIRGTDFAYTGMLHPSYLGQEFSLCFTSNKSTQAFLFSKGERNK